MGADNSSNPPQAAAKTEGKNIPSPDQLSAAKPKKTTQKSDLDLLEEEFKSEVIVAKADPLVTNITRRAAHSIELTKKNKSMPQTKEDKLREVLSGQR